MRFNLNIEYQILTILSQSNLKKDTPKLIISKRDVWLAEHNFIELNYPAIKERFKRYQN